MFMQDQNWNRRQRPHNWSNRPSSGFTLVELLVVISIIGMLIAMLLPAVFAAIESARRNSCQVNMKQIAIAATSYETALKQYPFNWGQVSSPGTMGGSASSLGTSGVPSSYPTTGGAVGVSWLAGLLPNLDNGPLYSQAALGKDPTITLAPGAVATMQPLSYVNAANGISNYAVLCTVVNTFLCPSDTQTGHISNQMLDNNSMQYATTNYKGCAGSNWVGSSDFPTLIPPSSWNVGRNAYSIDGLDHGNGVVCRGGGSASGGAPIMTGNMDIRDGASNTFLLGESVPAYCGWSLWYWFEGSTATCGIPVNYFTSAGVTPDNNFANWKDSMGFMSRHRGGGANFAMCDGSVSFVSETIDFGVYKAEATIDGNEVPTQQ
jgi:prepilin-type N-terminal cleavage/methylation domain-containing protein/prepilin-type processing-associated H-X9-DG protein